MALSELIELRRYKDETDGLAIICTYNATPPDMTTIVLPKKGDFMPGGLTYQGNTYSTATVAGPFLETNGIGWTKQKEGGFPHLTLRFKLLDLEDPTHVAVPADTYLELKGRRLSPFGVHDNIWTTTGVCMAWPVNGGVPPLGFPKAGDLLFGTWDSQPPQASQGQLIQRAVYPQRVRLVQEWIIGAVQRDIW